MSGQRARSHSIGKKGEEIATKHLVEKGYIIRERNWRIRHLEVDIIALFDNTLIFIEVKTRTHLRFGTPHEAVTERKIEHLLDAAQAYVDAHKSTLSIRFDLILILYQPNLATYHLEHIPDAFF